ncbi:MAG: hypothetical protein RLZZ267_1235 [Bacillota bacterium]|jgi:uncharacterized cofD-like protein
MSESRPQQDWPRVVVIGGGTGLSVMLRGLKEKEVQITAIVTVADDGGSSGVLRNELQMVPPGDIRNVITALADVEPLLSQLLSYRFKTGSGLAGHSLGNLILAAMNDITGDFVDGIKELSRVLAVRGRVLPAAATATVLKAEMADGTIVTGESQIPKTEGKIRRVFIEPANVEPLEEAIQVIQEADAIVIGPGSLFTSILPNLLVPGIADAIKQSGAAKIFVCNVMTQPGETDDFTVNDHIEAIVSHVGHPLFDYIIVNNGEIPVDIRDKYIEQGARAVRFDETEVRNHGYKIIADKLFTFQTYLRHDTVKLSKRINQIIQEWKQ